MKPSQSYYINFEDGNILCYGNICQCVCACIWLYSRTHTYIYALSVKFGLQCKIPTRE